MNKAPWFANLTTYLSYSILFVFGYMRDFFNSIFKRTLKAPQGYAPLLRDFEDFYTRRMYKRIHDGWNRPICSAPGSRIEVMERKSYDNNKTLTLTGRTMNCLNLGSYNYLGFGDPDSTTKPSVMKALKQYSVSSSSTRLAVGTTKIHTDLEKLVARFVGKPDAMIFGMGFGTNASGIPSLVGKGSLIVSDSLNHSSIAFGCRSSGAKIKVFRHSDVVHLEQVIRRAIIDGQPRTHRPYTKILIMVEGIYSMEGEMCPLPEIVKIKKKYGCYLYVDEAHSIGALGKTGRGICEFTGVNPKDVDILMGTFTKSFGGVGGYLASSKEVVAYLRQVSAGSVYSAGISSPTAQQIYSAMKIIMGEDGTDLGQRKLTALRENANTFRRRMMEIGCHVLGEWDSPVIPIMLYTPAKIIAFSRECLKRGLAVVVVGFPAAPLLESRARVCISAAHTKEDLEDAIAKIDEVCELLFLKYAIRQFG